MLVGLFAANIGIAAYFAILTLVRRSEKFLHQVALFLVVTVGVAGMLNWTIVMVVVILMTWLVIMRISYKAFGPEIMKETNTK